MRGRVGPFLTAQATAGRDVLWGVGRKAGHLVARAIIPPQASSDTHTLRHREMEKVVKGTCYAGSKAALPCQVP